MEQTAVDIVPFVLLITKGSCTVAFTYGALYLREYMGQL